MSTPSDDAQREMEQRALRNVRGLVDKVEGLDADEKRRERRMLVGLVAVALIAALAIVGWLTMRSDSSRGTTVTIQPAKR
jgi:hypothetical protein